jgi:anthranilate/para-aminobenzoate synthase component I
VADSSPAAEYAEVLAKSAALRRALEMAREGV